MKWSPDVQAFVVDLPADVAGVKSLSQHAVYEPIVRCRDCAKAEGQAGVLVCKRHDGVFEHTTDPDGFCAWGEPRRTKTDQEERS